MLLAAAALGLWRTRWMREERRHRRGPLYEGIALGCALVLLFFAVSLSDDLRADVILFDECSAGRRHTACAHHSTQQGKNVQTAACPAILTRVQSFNPLRRIGTAVPARYSARTNSLSDAGFGRAPPSIFL
jgi:hypothetical protein